MDTKVSKFNRESVRFFDKIKLDSSGCWLWIGGKDSDGYGKIYYEGSMVCAHSFAVMIMKGTLSKKRERDHLCRIRACVNPFHVEEVTHRVNCNRGDTSWRGRHERNKTHCAKGHEYTVENTKIYTYNGKSKRYCITCGKLKSRKGRLEYANS